MTTPTGHHLPRSRPGVFLALLVLAVVAGVVLLWREPSPADPITRRDSVSLLGDSIFAGAEATLRQTLGDRWNVRLDAVSGLTTADQIQGAERLAGRAVPADHLVVNLGTNDVFREVPLEESRRSLDEILAKFDSVRCIHLVTVTDKLRPDRATEVIPSAVAFNAMLRGFATDPRVRIIEWAQVLDANDADAAGPLLADQVHPNERGNVVLGDAVATSLAGCR